MLKRATKIAAGLYLGALLLLLVLWLAVGEAHWLLILLRYAPAVIYLLPLLPLVGLAAWAKTRPHPLYVLTLLGVLIYFLGFQVPALGTRPDGELKVMTFNIRAGLQGAQQIAEFLETSGCDLVGLQEARKPSAADLPDPVPTLEAGLPGYSMARGGIRGELVILTPHTIKSSTDRSLNGLSQALEAVVDVDGQLIRVLNVHLMTGDPKGILKKGSDIRARLALTAQTRHQQTDALLELLADTRYPTILMGDFNTPPNSDDHARLKEVLTDSFQSVGWGFGYTYSAKRPVWRIDYIWHSQELAAVSCQVQGTALSDHRPLTATLGRTR